eukprot:6636717-Alexandrium_andersonii.AAC.1
MAAVKRLKALLAAGPDGQFVHPERGMHLKGPWGSHIKPNATDADLWTLVQRGIRARGGAGTVRVTKIKAP